MAMLIRTAPALALGVALFAGLLCGPDPQGAASAFDAMVVFEDPVPPPSPGPLPNEQPSINPAPPQDVPEQHRRHIDGDPAIER
jgi:hypothetical protein